MNIVYYKDLVNFLMKAKQNILVISSTLLFEKTILEIKVINGNVSLIDSDDSLHENLLCLMLKTSWTPNDVKAIVGYCVIMDLLTTINSDEVIKNPAYSVIADITNGAWRSAFTSDSDINKYKQQMSIYNKISPEERLMIDIGQIEGMSEPKNPLVTNKKIAIHGMQKLFINKNILTLCREIPYGGDVISLNGKKTILTHFDFIYHFEQELPEYVAVDKICDESYKIDGFEYRIQHTPTLDGGSISTFRCMVPMTTIELERINDNV
jgi:hypothetical protein